MRFCDEHDGNVYVYVVIGTQTWMAENLNRNIGNSACYKGIPANCVKYGRLYDYLTAITACPYGWHLPSEEEYKSLTTVHEAKKLKARFDWGNDGNGTDDYGFSALPGGGYDNDATDYFGESTSGFWWTADENTDNGIGISISAAYDAFIMAYGNYGKSSMLSVRCVKD